MQGLVRAVAEAVGDHAGLVTRRQRAIGEQRQVEKAARRTAGFTNQYRIAVPIRRREVEADVNPAAVDLDAIGKPKAHPGGGRAADAADLDMVAARHGLNHRSADRGRDGHRFAGIRATDPKRSIGCMAVEVGIKQQRFGGERGGWCQRQQHAKNGRGKEKQAHGGSARGKGHRVMSDFDTVRRTVHGPPGKYFRKPSATPQRFVKSHRINVLRNFLAVSTANQSVAVADGRCPVAGPAVCGLPRKCHANDRCRPDPSPKLDA